MMKFYNKKHKNQTYKINQKVMLFSKNIRIKKFSKKLADKYLKLFRISGIISKNAYRLNLPKNYRRIYSTFYITLLELYCRKEE